RMRPRHVMSAAMLIVMAAMLVGCDDLDVFDYRGEAFLLFYGYGFAIALVASLLLARVIAGIVSTRAKNHSLSDPYEIALLGGGARRVLDAALAALFARKMLEIQSHGSQNPATLHRVPDVMASQMHPVEEKVLNALPQDLRSLRKRFEPVAEKLRANLEAAGWMLTNSQRSQIQLITAVPLVLMMLVGLVKVFVGMDRDKPVMFLVFALLVSLIVTVVILSKVRRRTTAGDAEWKRLARPTTAPRLTSSPPLFADIGGLAAMAVAVTGVQALAGSGYESLYQTIRHPQATSSSGCGSSGCGTSGCGGGGGDSGGSGCSSGCGGCGGGGD
ncbi:MAG: TIGR04222 domain-containing membrane protein, partial [Prosthecobacter sp.]